ncbi:MAG: voltage-gated chloride channel family protein [Planctomycetes bacterium]|nr:voltage-gated chloride channel family protein [Planctomycetota bacterium]
MPFRWNPREHISHSGYVLKWALISTPVGLAVGSACAIFIWSLDKVTNTRLSYPWLLYLLPIAGVPVVWLYHRLGKGMDRGNNLIVDEIHQPGGGVPVRMAPLILIATLVTHLFGGSAGREGTAVQMGGSIAGGYARLLHRFFKWMGKVDTRTLLMTGVAAGFAGVFGTPLAGAIFAMEVLAIGQMSYAAVIPCLIAAILADWTCSIWRIQHDTFHLALVTDPTQVGTLAHLHWPLMLKVVLAAALFGLVSLLFSELTHSLHRLFTRLIRPAILHPVVGGLFIIALVHLLGTRDYLGLGNVSPELGGVSISSAFIEGGAYPWSWWWKLLFTAITLGAGFKGGEVTPLFFIGATLGNTLAWLFHAPVDLFAALGFTAVFAGATNTPLASTIMAVELFGPQNAVYFAVASFVAYLFSGHSGVYLSQRIGTPKPETPTPGPEATLHSAREQRPWITSLLRGKPRK